MGSSFFSASRRSFSFVGQNHGPHVSNAILGKEHVLGAAEADALCSEHPCLLGIARNVRIGANPQLAERIDPAHELHQIRIIRLRGQRLQLACDHAAGGAVQRNPVALP